MDNQLVKDGSYLVIQSWMITRLNLKGNSLLAYAIIYGFSQDNHSDFHGTLRYLASWMSCTNEGARQVLDKLVEQKLIFKDVIYENGVRYVRYRTNPEYVGGYQTMLGGGANIVGGDDKQCLSNNNKKYTKDNIVVEQQVSDNVDKLETTSDTSNNSQQIYKDIDELTVTELQQLKKIILENRDNQKITYRQIQKQFNLTDKITYDTPTLCNKLIKQKEQQNKKNSIKKCTGVSEEIF